MAAAVPKRAAVLILKQKQREKNHTENVLTPLANAGDSSRGSACVTLSPFYRFAIRLPIFAVTEVHLP